MSGTAGAGTSSATVLLAQPSLTENLQPHLGQFRDCMITSEAEWLKWSILTSTRCTRNPSADDREKGKQKMVTRLQIRGQSSKEAPACAT